MGRTSRRQCQQLLKAEYELIYGGQRQPEPAHGVLIASLFRRPALLRILQHARLLPMEAALAAEVMPDYFERLEARILQEFAEGVSDWGRSVTALSGWEQEHLLDS